MDIITATFPFILSFVSWNSAIFIYIRTSSISFTIIIFLWFFGFIGIPFLNFYLTFILCFLISLFRFMIFILTVCNLLGWRWSLKILWLALFLFNFSERCHISRSKSIQIFLSFFHFIIMFIKSFLN